MVQTLLTSGNLKNKIGFYTYKEGRQTYMKEREN